MTTDNIVAPNGDGGNCEAAPTDWPRLRQETRKLIQQNIQGSKNFPRNPDRSFTKPNLEHGWLQPILIELDLATWGRWDWWSECYYYYEQHGEAIAA